MSKFIIKKLQIGDTVVVSTVLGGLKEYPVKEVEGNKAYTDFRTFNRNVYAGGQVYECGRNNTTNGYWLKNES